jgi:hypothetical protein
VIATRAAFRRGGLEAIREKQKRKRSRRVLSPALEQKILDTTLKTRPCDATQWSVRTLARHLGVSRTLVHGVWQRYEVQPHRVEKFKLSNDPQFEEKVRDVVGLYPSPPRTGLSYLAWMKRAKFRPSDWNDEPQPFVWKATADVIPDKCGARRKPLQRTRPDTIRIGNLSFRIETFLRVANPSALGLE